MPLCGINNECFCMCSRKKHSNVSKIVKFHSSFSSCFCWTEMLRRESYWQFRWRKHIKLSCFPFNKYSFLTNLLFCNSLLWFDTIFTVPAWELIAYITRFGGIVVQNEMAAKKYACWITGENTTGKNHLKNVHNGYRVQNKRVFVLVFTDRKLQAQH